MEAIEKKIVWFEDGRQGLLCGLDYCEDRHYAKGYCNGHYEQMRKFGETRPKMRTLPYPPCGFEGCRNRSITKTGRILCQGHINQITKSHPRYIGMLRPLKYYMREGMTDVTRTCKDCFTEKPLSEFYDRNQWKKRDSVSKSVRCKDCYKLDIAYYQGVRTTKADGTDPLDYKGDPEVRQARLTKSKRKAQD
jgi:hypothetical protein